MIHEKSGIEIDFDCDCEEIADSPCEHVAKSEMEGEIIKGAVFGGFMDELSIIHVSEDELQR